MSPIKSALFFILLSFFFLTSCRQSNSDEILPTVAVTTAPPTIILTATNDIITPTDIPATRRPTATATFAPPPTPIVSLRPTATLPPISSDPFLTVGKPVVGFLTDQIVQKWYFSAKKDELINLSAQSLETGLDLILDIQNKLGESILPQGAIDQNYTHETINQLLIPKDDQYTVLVYTFANNKGKYELLLQKGGQTTTNNNLFISLNDLYTQTLAAETTQDYLFIPENNTAIQIVVTGLISSFDPLIELYYQDAKLLRQDINFDQSETINFLPDANESYIIRIADFNEIGGPYTISIQQDEQTAGQLKDPGSLFKQTLFLQSEETISYQFRNLKGSSIIALLSGDAAQTAELSLLAPHLISTAIKSDTEQLLFNYPLEVATNYTLTLRNSSTTPSSFEFSLLLPEETILYLPLDQEITGLLASHSNLSYFFTPQSSMLVQLTGYPNPNLDMVLRVYSQTNLNFPIAETDETFAGEPEQLRFYAEANEDYLIEIVSFGESNGRFRFILAQP